MSSFKLISLLILILTCLNACEAIMGHILPPMRYQQQNLFK